MNTIRVFVAIIAGLVPSCIWAQSQLSATTGNLIVRYRQGISQKVVAILTSDVNGKKAGRSKSWTSTGLTEPYPTP